VAGKELKVISISDEALDVHGLPPGRIGQYVEKRDDFATLVEGHYIPGKRPTIYTLREIPNRVFQWVLERPTETARAFAAFQAALLRVEDLQIEDGAIVTLAEGMARHENGVLRDEELERFDPHDLLEIGDVAFMRSFFRRKTVRVYRLPPLLLELWASQVVRHAAPSPALPESNSSAASSPSPAATEQANATTSTSPTPGAGSGSSTAATAQDPSQKAAA
jgi:hypothetical protein